MELSVFLPDVIDQNDPNIQEFFSTNPEFTVLKSAPDEKIEARGQYYNHQMLTDKILRVVKKMLIISETGTGKSCEVLKHFEYLNGEFEKRENQVKDYDLFNSKYDSCYIITKRSLINELKKQLLCKCSDDRFGFVSYNNQKKILRRERYYFYTYNGFQKYAKRETNNFQPNLIKDKFNNSAFWIDEAHYYILQSEGDVTDKSLQTKIRDYDALEKVFRHSPGSKKILSTATPMLNRVSDLYYVANLLLDDDKKIPLDYVIETIEDIEPYLRGMIGYIKAYNLGVEVREMGENFEIEEGKGVTLFPAYLNDEQSGYYNENAGDATDFLNKKISQISTYIFPNQLEGDEGIIRQQAGLLGDQEILERSFDRYFQKNNDGKFVPTSDFVENNNTLEKVAKYSPKCFNILSAISSEPGKKFIYIEALKGAGAILVDALHNVTLGYEQVNPKKSHVSTRVKTDEKKGLCVQEESSEKILLTKKKRVSMLHGEMSEQEKRNVMQLFESTSNKFGDYSEVLISTSVGKEGINLTGIVQVHIVSPNFNESATYQAISRAIRAGSYKDLLERDGSVTVKVYRHCAITNDGDSWDFSLYKLSQEKNFRIRKVMRMLKQISLGCNINKERNTQGVDYSPACDYEPCKFDCYQDILVEDVEVEEQPKVRKIKREYKDFAKIATDDFESLATESKDSFGRNNFIKFVGNYSFRVLEKAADRPEDNYYSKHLFLNKTTNLRDVIVKKLRDEYDRKYEKIKKLFEEGNEIKSEVFAHTIDENIYMIENRIIYEKNQAFKRKFLSFFSLTVFEIEKQNERLKIEEQKYKEKLARAKKKAKESKVTIQKLEDIERYTLEKGTGKIYLHILEIFRSDKLKHAVINNIKAVGNKIRYFDYTSRKWRYLNTVELEVYNPIMRLIVNDKFEEFSKKYRFFGTIFPSENEFRIIESDSESKKSGRICEKGIKKKELIEVLWFLGVKAFQMGGMPPIDDIRTYVKSKIGVQKISTFNDEKVVFYYEWLQAKNNNETICYMIQQKMKEDDMILF